MRDAFIAALEELAAHDERIVLITGDLGFGVLERFKERFPDRYFNAGVAEQNMTGLATGIALEGRIVFTYSIGNFPTLRCLEQLRNDACYHGANVNAVAIGGGFSYGPLGYSHHATEDLAILRALPDLTVVSPGCKWEVRQATAALVAKSGAGYLRLDKSSAGETGRPGETFTLGRARVLREGTDVSLLATGGVLAEALSAADELSKRGISARVVSVHTISPLDEETVLACARETRAIISIEEHGIRGGLGGAIAEVCLERGAAPKSFYRVGLRSGFSTIVGSQQYLRERYGIDRAAIVAAVERALA